MERIFAYKSKNGKVFLTRVEALRDEMPDPEKEFLEWYEHYYISEHKEPPMQANHLVNWLKKHKYEVLDLYGLSVWGANDTR